MSEEWDIDDPDRAGFRRVPLHVLPRGAKIQPVPDAHEPAVSSRAGLCQETPEEQNYVSHSAASEGQDGAGSKRSASLDRPHNGVSVKAGSGAATSPPGTSSIAQKLVEGEVIEALRGIYDPEIPVNIYDLGLIYEIAVDPEMKVRVKMTLTAPACPVAGSLPGEVEKRIEAINSVKSANVELVWEPAWSKDRMSEAAQLELGMF